jgi:chemotaxis signal transduction protein
MSTADERTSTADARTSTADERTMAADERRILEARARALARSQETESPDDTLAVAVFALAREQYALELSCLRHVFALRELAFLPGAEPPLIGVTAWRGELIRVLDLTRILDVPQGGPTDRGQVLVLGGDDRHFAILADSILDMTTLEKSALTELGEGRFLRAVTADAIALLDGAALIRTYA